MKLLRVLIGLMLASALTLVFDEQVQAVDILQSDAGAGDNGKLMPSIGVALDYEWFAPNRYDYASVLRRAVDVMILRRHGFFASFLVSEETLFYDSGEFKNYPYKIKYNMDYINAGYEFSSSSLSVVIDHICYNVIDHSENTDMMQLRWYGAGVKWETFGMKIGRKDEGMSFSTLSPFEWLCSFQFMLYAGRKIYVERFLYDEIIRAVCRYDILRWHTIIPYLETAFQGLVDNRLRVDASVEGGLRLRLSRIDLIPYVRYMHMHDSELYNDRAADFFIAGISAESLLGEAQWGSGPRGPEETLSSPEIHFSGGYAKYYGSAYLGYQTDIGMYLDLVRIRSFTVNGSSRVKHDSTAEANALYPRYLYYSFDSGIEYDASRELFFRAWYSHERRHDGNAYRGGTETADMTGVSIGTIGIKPGFSNARIGREEFERAGVLNNVEWLFSIGWIFHDTFYPYNLDIRARMRWDMFFWKKLIPYVMPDIHYLRGDISDIEYGIEPGVRMIAGFTVMLYYRYEYRVNIDRVSGMDERHHLIGIRLEI